MDFKTQPYNAFEMFDQKWALVTAGALSNFNSCTVSWGSFGNIWGSPGQSKATVTIYVHPDRYTSEFLKGNDRFTVSFFPEENKEALVYMGSHSGRDGNKAEAAGLTPIPLGNTVGYKEASLTFVCRKMYQHQLAKQNLVPDIQAYYSHNSKVFPDGNGGWQPHIVFVGEILEVIDKR